MVSCLLAVVVSSWQHYTCASISDPSPAEFTVVLRAPCDPSNRPFRSGRFFLFDPCPTHTTINLQDQSYAVRAAAGQLLCALLLATSDPDAMLFGELLSSLPLALPDQLDLSNLGNTNHRSEADNLDDIFSDHSAGKFRMEKDTHFPTSSRSHGR